MVLEQQFTNRVMKNYNHNIDVEEEQSIKVLTLSDLPGRFLGGILVIGHFCIIVTFVGRERGYRETFYIIDFQNCLRTCSFFCVFVVCCCFSVLVLAVVPC